MKKTPTELKSGGTMMAIQVLESFEVARDQDELRDDHGEIGNGQRGDDEGEQHVAPEELEAREGVAGHAGDQHRDDGEDRRGRDAVEERTDEAALRLKRRPVVGERAAREQRHRPLEEIRLRQRRIGDHQPERHQPDQRERHEQEMQERSGRRGGTRSTLPPEQADLEDREDAGHQRDRIGDGRGIAEIECA